MKKSQWIKLTFLFILSNLSGIFGRAGGSGKPYKSWMRDWTIPVLYLFILHLWYKPTIDFKLYLIYLIVYILMGLSLTTYWDWLFNGWDNFFMAGFMVGMSAIPLIFLNIGHLSYIIIRAILLGLVWGLINKYIPSKFLIWRRDVAEEFLRYASVIATIPLLLF